MFNLLILEYGIRKKAHVYVRALKISGIKQQNNVNVSKESLEIIVLNV
jgi:hypothetical protein